MNKLEDDVVIERIKRNVTTRKLNLYFNYIKCSCLFILILYVIEFITQCRKTSIFEFYFGEPTCIDYIIVILVFTVIIVSVKWNKFRTYYNFEKVSRMESKEQISKRLKHNLYKYYISYKISGDYEISKYCIPRDDFYIKLNDGTIYKVEKTLLYKYEKEKRTDIITVDSIAV